MTITGALIAVGLGMATGEFLWHGLTDRKWGEAIDHTYYIAWALFAAWLVLRWGVR